MSEATREEKVFFDDGDVVVTNARLIASGQTYSMANITSVKIGHRPAQRKWWRIVVAVFMMPVAHEVNRWYVIALILLCVALWRHEKGKQDMYAVAIHTSGGEQDATESPSKGYINGIIKAINEAMIYRG